jgi:hypothetical protein
MGAPLEANGVARLGGVVVLGMHRSGTSAVAGFLARAGFYAGEDGELLAPAEDNPKGFFERTDVNELNDRILSELGGSWDRPPRRRSVAEKAPAWSDRVASVLDRLGEGAGGAPLLLKDPRISLLLPLWLPSLEGRFAFVLVDRGPLDTAWSVRRRDGRPLYVALALWQLYWSALVEGLAGRKVLVVHYERFVEGPAGEGAALVSRLEEVLGARPGALEPRRAEGFVSLEMRHHHTALDSPESLDVLTGSQLSLARWLAGLPSEWLLLEPPHSLRAESEAALTAAAEYFDAVADRHGMETAYDLERHKALHFEQATELKDRHIENLEAQLAALQREVEASSSRLGELEAKAARLQAENEALASELRRLHEDGRAAASNFFSVARRGLFGAG